MSETLSVVITGKDGVSRVFQEVSKSADRVGDAVEDAGKRGKKGMDELGKSAEQNAQRMERVRNEATAIGAVFGVLAAGAIKAGAAYRDQRLDLQSLEAQYGTASDEIINFTQVMQDSLNTSNDAARDVALTFATLFRNYEMTETQIQSLMERTADIASARGRNAVEVSQMIQNALRGEAEYIEQIGVTLNETFVASQYAARGLGNWNTLTDEAAKAQFRYVLLMEQTIDTQGRAGEEAARAGGQFRRFLNEMQDAGQTVGQFLGPIGEVAAEMAPIAMALPVVTAGLGRMTTGLRNSRIAASALTFAINPMTLTIGAAATGAYILWDAFQDGERAAKTLGEALKELDSIQENLSLSGEDDRVLAIQGMEDYIAHVREAAEARKNAFIHGSSDYQWAEVERLGVETLGEAYAFYNHEMDISSEEADRLAAAQMRLGNAMADSRVDADELSGAVERLWMRFMTDRTYSIDQFIADLEAIDITQFRADLDDAADAAVGLSAALALIRPEVQGLVQDFLAFNEIGEDDSFGERFLKTLGLDLATLSEIEVRIGRLRGAWADIESDMPEPDADQAEWMAWVNQAERGTIEWYRRTQAANEARRAEQQAAIDTTAALEAANIMIGGATDGLDEMARTWDDVGESATSALAIINERAREDLEELIALTAEFITGMQELAGIDLADRVNLAGLGTDATMAASAIGDVGAALDSVLGIYSQIDALGQRMSQAGGIVDALFGPDGDPSDGVGPLRDVYDAGLIGVEQFNSAIEDGIQIQQAAAESQLYLNKMRADQLPILNDTTQAYLDQIKAISELGAEEQMVALGWMDSGMQGRVEQFTEMISMMNNFGAEGEAAMQQVIDGIVATDPVLTAMLENLGLIERQLDGSYTLSLDAEGAVSDIERLTASIDALTLALGGTPPSYDIDVTGVEDVEAANALIRAMDDHEINVTFGTSGLEQGKEALRRALGDVGGDGEGVTVPVTLQVPTDLPPLPQPDPIEVPITFTTGAGFVGDAVSGALGAFGGKDGATVTITAIDNASDTINEVIAAALAIPTSESIDVSAPGATGTAAELNAVTAAAQGIPEIEVISVVASGATEAANALNAVAAAANSIPSTVNTTVTTTIRTINLGTDNNVLPGGRHGGIPGYAHGGVLFEGGEAGPEIAHFATGGMALLPHHAIYEAPRGTYIEPASSVGRVRAGGRDVVINNYGTIIGVDELTELIGSAVIEAQAEEAARYNRAHGRVAV